MRKYVLLVVAALIGACATSSTTTDTPESEAPALTDSQIAHLDAMVGEFVQSQGYPNFAMGVVVGSELVWTRGLGEGTHPGMPPDENTLFRAGSVTKLVTATAMLRLVEDGKLSLDDEAAQWLPEAEATLAPDGRPAVTLRHLLSHASGIPSIGNGTINWTRPDASISEADLLAALDGVSLDFDPGTSRAYSNLGSALAGLVISRASGESYRSFVQREIFDALGMSASVWDPPASGLAPGHLFSAHGGYESAPATWRMGAMEPAGGLFTNVADLARFAAFGLGHAGVLQADTLELAQKAVEPLAGHPGYGLGFIESAVPSVGRVVWHNGSTSDYGAFFALLPEQDLGVVILIGSGSYGDVPEIESLGIATLAYLVDPETKILPQPSTSSAAAIEKVGERLLALASAPTKELVEEAFTPRYLAGISATSMLEFFEGIANVSGGCTSYEVLEDRGQGSFLLLLDCASANWTADAVVEADAAFRLERIEIYRVQ